MCIKKMFNTAVVDEKIREYRLKQKKNFGKAETNRQ